MRYKSKLWLQKVVRAQNITVEYQRKYGSSQQWIYENVIREQFGVSKSTYDRWLGRNVKQELSKLEENEDKSEKN